MKKKDFFRDISRLVKDLEKQDRSTVARVEEQDVHIVGKKTKLKTESVFQARVGLPTKEELEALRKRKLNRNPSDQNRLRE